MLPPDARHMPRVRVLDQSGHSGRGQGLMRGSEGARERGEHTVVLVFAEHDLDRIDVGRVDLTRRIAQGAATDNGDKVLERRLQVHPLPKQKSTRT